MGAHRAGAGSSRPSSASSDRLAWSGEHATTHHKISVALRSDRKPMVSMFEQGSQVCQIHLDAFPGDLGSQKREAFQLMQEIAMSYVCDRIKKCDLYSTRDDRLERLGMLRPRKGRAKGSKAKARPAGVEKEEDGFAGAGEAGSKALSGRKRGLVVKRRPAATKQKPAAAKQKPAVAKEPAAAAEGETLTH